MSPGEQHILSGRQAAGLGDYLAGRVPEVSLAELDALIDRYEWFATARRARVLLTGRDDDALVLSMMFSPTLPPLPAKAVVETEVGVVTKDEGRRRTTVSRKVPQASKKSSSTGKQGAFPSSVGRTKHSPENRIIDRFLKHGGYRIVPGDDTQDLAADGFARIDADLATAELAEIYRAQGLSQQADEIDRILHESGAAPDKRRCKK